MIVSPKNYITVIALDNESMKGGPRGVEEKKKGPLMIIIRTREWHRKAFYK